MKKEHILNEVDAAYETLTDYQKLITLSYATIKLNYILDDPDSFSALTAQAYLLSEFNIEFSDIEKLKEAGFIRLYNKLNSKDINDFIISILANLYGIKETVEGLEEKIELYNETKKN